MNWENQPWRKLYIDSDPDFKALPPLTRGLFAELIKVCDRTGYIRLGRKGLQSLISILGAGNPWEQLEPYVKQLLDDGCLVHDAHENTLWLRNFEEAQKARKGASLRQKEWRQRKKEEAKTSIKSVDKSSTEARPTRVDETSTTSRREVNKSRQVETIRSDKIRIEEEVTSTSTVSSNNGSSSLLVPLARSAEAPRARPPPDLKLVANRDLTPLVAYWLEEMPELRKLELKKLLKFEKLTLSNFPSIDLLAESQDCWSYWSDPSSKQTKHPNWLARLTNRFRMAKKIQTEKANPPHPPWQPGDLTSEQRSDDERLYGFRHLLDTETKERYRLELISAESRNACYAIAERYRALVPRKAAEP